MKLLIPFLVLLAAPVFAATEIKPLTQANIETAITNDSTFLTALGGTTAGKALFQISGNGTNGQVPSSNGSGGVTWATVTSGTTYTAGTGITLPGNAITFTPADGSIALAKLASDPLARANHTGTQAHTTITGLGTASTTNTQLRQFRAYDYGARADGVTLYDGTYTSGDATFTSATANFTAEDVGKSIVLQLSQTSRQITTIASRTSATEVELTAAPTASSSAYTPRITTYGSDNTAEIQAAIDAAATGGGGSIQFDGGVYLCTGSPSDTSNRNSIFSIPYASDPRATVPPTIEFIGAVPPVVSFFDPDQLPNNTSTIIYCPNQTVTGTDPSIFAAVKGGASQDAITASTPGATTYWGSVTTSTAFKNITIRQYPNPKMHALQFRYAGRLTADDVSFDLDVRYSSSTNLLSNPETGAARAIICPERLSGYGSNIEKAYAYGYYVGIEIGDLTEVGHFTAEFCFIAATSRTSTNYLHANVLNSYRCKYALFGPLRIFIDNLNIETYRGGGITYAPSWCQNTNGNYDIDNQDGTIGGRIHVCTVLAGTGRVTTTVRNPTSAASLLEVFDGHLGANIGNANYSKIDVATRITAGTPTLSTAGTAGSTTYKYRVLYIMPGGAKVLSPEATITTGNATLDATNKIGVTIPNVNGAASFWLYRTSSAGTPSTTGRLTGVSTEFIPASGVAVYDTGLAGDSTTPEQTSGQINAEKLKLTGTAADDSTSVLSRAESDTRYDARYGQRIYHELAGDLSNGVAGTTVDANTVTLPVGKWLVRGSLFTTRNATTSNCTGKLLWVSGGTTTGRIGRNTWHAATYNGDPYTFVTAGSAMDNGLFSSGGAPILGGVGMDTAAGTSKVMLTTGNGFITVTGTPAVLRFQVTQNTADAGNPAILKAAETFVEFTKTN